MSDCKLCNGNFNFSKVRISKILDEIEIIFIQNPNEVTWESMFKFCPLCGEELTDEDFKLHTNQYKDCLSCANSFSEERPNGDVLHCMLFDDKIVEENQYCDEWN